MAFTKRIRSIAQVRGTDDQLITECYVVAIGYTGLSALSEHPLSPGILVMVDVTFVGPDGGVEAETVAARAVDCTPRSGSYSLELAFVQVLKPESSSRLAAFIRREVGPERTSTPAPRYREAAGGSA